MEKKFRTFSARKRYISPNNEKYRCAAEDLAGAILVLNTPDKLFPSYQPILTKMLPKAKKYLITTETHEVFIVRNGRERIYGFCAECEKESEMLNLDSAVTVSGRRAREIFLLVEIGAIHSLETTGGHLLICRDSLFGMEK